MQELAKIDKEKFQDTYADLKYFEMKTGRRPNANERKEVSKNLYISAISYYLVTTFQVSVFELLLFY